MPVKGIDKVKRNYKVAVDQICDRKTYNAIYSILSSGGAEAQFMTPKDSGFLMDSQYAPQITISGGKASGSIGYTAAYAYLVHQKPGTMMGQPRANGNGNYWDNTYGSSGEPRFLEKGFENIESAIPMLLKNAYK